MEKRNNLYRIQDDDRPMYVLAPSFSEALERWRALIRRENPGDPENENADPEGISFVEYAELILGDDPIDDYTRGWIDRIGDAQKELDEARAEVQNYKRILDRIIKAGEMPVSRVEDWRKAVLARAGRAGMPEGEGLCDWFERMVKERDHAYKTIEEDATRKKEREEATSGERLIPILKDGQWRWYDQDGKEVSSRRGVPATNEEFSQDQIRKAQAAITAFLGSKEAAKWGITMLEDNIDKDVVMHPLGFPVEEGPRTRTIKISLEEIQ